MMLGNLFTCSRRGTLLNIATRRWKGNAPSRSDPPSLCEESHGSLTKTDLKEALKEALHPIHGDLKRLGNSINNLESNQQQTNNRLNSLDSNQQQMNNRLNSLDSNQQQISNRLNSLDSNQQQISNRLNSLDSSFKSEINQINKQLNSLARQQGYFSETAARSIVSKRLGESYVQHLLITDFEDLLTPFYGEGILPKKPQISDLQKAINKVGIQD
jgi:chromosome segregation ATPase